ncbi:MAG: EVE domain-containing protein [Gemmatimonadales bacterium]
MAHWILKTEPGDYSFDDLRRDGSTAWTGITNAQALINLRAMARGDEALIYHSGAQKALVGRATITRAAYPDPAKKDPRLAAVGVRAGAPLPSPVTLAQVKDDPAFKDLLLVRNSRLSVIPVAAPLFAKLLAMGRVR